MENKNAVWIALVVGAVFLIIGIYLFYRYKKITEGMPGYQPVFPWEQQPDPNPYAPPPDTPDPEDPPDTPPDPGDPGNDPYRPGGFEVIKLQAVRSGKHSITFLWSTHYYATICSGTFRVGGKVFTNVRIEYKKNGSWRHIETKGGWPEGFTQFAVTINDQCQGIKFVAEQGAIPFVGERFIDEVNGQMFIEVG